MLRHKSFLAVFIMLLLPALFWGADEKLSQEKGYKLADVEALYETVRTRGPIYQYDEQIVTFQNEGMNLVATLVVPRTGKRPPIVMTLNGFGEDRFYVEIPNTGGEHFYPRVSRLLAEQGIATLRIDFRGSGDSDGEYQITRFTGQVSDALAGIQHICRRLRHRVDWKRLGLIGFSQGGLVAAITASMDSRVDAIALWSAVANPPTTYEALITKQGLLNGLALPIGGFDTYDIYIEGVLYGSIPLGRGFFVDVFTVDPVAHIKDFNGPMLYAAGLQDILVWPQPHMGLQYMKYHEGFEKLITLDTDHEFKTYEGPDEFDKVIYWSAAWFLYTLN